MVYLGLFYFVCIGEYVPLFFSYNLLKTSKYIFTKLSENLINMMQSQIYLMIASSALS